MDYQHKKYTYSKAGNITDIENMLTNTTLHYTYYNLHRLKTETSSASSDSIQYNYDAIGRITSKTTVQGGVFCPNARILEKS